MITLGELAAYLRLEAAPEHRQIELFAPAALERAAPGNFAFISQAKYLPALRDTGASCVITRKEWAAESPAPVLVAEDPYLAYARASELFETRPAAVPGIHPSAVIDPSVSVPASACIGPMVCIEADVLIGEEVAIGHGCFLGRGARLGAGTRLAPQVVIYHDVELGERCSVHSGTVIGCDGFGFARGPEGWEKIAQIGTVRIGNRVDIGSGCTIDRGALDDTVIADGVIIDNQVHIAHNCSIGERTAIAGCVGMAGSTVIGADCSFAGQVGISGHVEICDNAHFNGQARVNRSIREPGNYSSGTPLEPTRQWARNAVRFSQLDALQKRVAALEAALQGAGDRKNGRDPEESGNNDS